MPRIETKTVARTKRQSNHLTKKRKQVYNSSTWQAIRYQVKQRDKICVYSPGPKNIDHIDHIIPLQLAHSLKFNLDNLQGLSMSEHSEKTLLDNQCTTVDQWFTIVFPFHCEKLNLTQVEAEYLKTHLQNLLNG